MSPGFVVLIVTGTITALLVILYIGLLIFSNQNPGKVHPNNRSTEELLRSRSKLADLVAQEFGWNILLRTVSFGTTLASDIINSVFDGKFGGKFRVRIGDDNGYTVDTINIKTVKYRNDYDDIIINAYFKLLEQRSRNKGFPTVAVFSAQFYQCLNDNASKQLAYDELTRIQNIFKYDAVFLGGPRYCI